MDALKEAQKVMNMHKKNVEEVEVTLKFKTEEGMGESGKKMKDVNEHKGKGMSYAS